MKGRLNSSLEAAGKESDSVGEDALIEHTRVVEKGGKGAATKGSGGACVECRQGAISPRNTNGVACALVSFAIIL